MIFKSRPKSHGLWLGVTTLTGRYFECVYTSTNLLQYLDEYAAGKILVELPSKQFTGPRPRALLWIERLSEMTVLGVISPDHEAIQCPN